jgi:hypothetical protein
VIKLQAPSQIIMKDEILHVTRETIIGFTDGKPIKRAAEMLDIKGNVQPLNGRDLLLVPEGDRFKEQYWVYTADKIFDNDRVTRRNVNFQVREVEAWGSFNRARIMRIDVGEHATP